MTYDVSLSQGDSDFIYFQVKQGGTPADISEATTLKFCMENDIRTIQHQIDCTKGADIPIKAANYARLGVDANKIGTTVSFSETEGWLTIHITGTETADYGVFFGNFLIILGGDTHTAPSDENDLTIYIKKRRFVESS
jgi:hypothetical protein